MDTKKLILVVWLLLMGSAEAALVTVSVPDQELLYHVSQAKRHGLCLESESLTACLTKVLDDLYAAKTLGRRRHLSEIGGHLRVELDSEVEADLARFRKELDQAREAAQRSDARARAEEQRLENKMEGNQVEAFAETHRESARLEAQMKR